jgi:hypothetical protein
MRKKVCKIIFQKNLNIIEQVILLTPKVLPYVFRGIVGLGIRFEIL